MLHYLRIRYKFFMMASLGLIAIILMSFLAQDISKDGFEKVKEVFEDSKKVQNIQQELIAPLFKLREITLSLVVAPNDDYRNVIRKDIYPIIEKLDFAFFNSKDEINIIWKNYKKLVFLTDNFIKQGFEEGAYTNVNSIEREQFYILINKLDNLQNTQLKNSKNTFKKAEKNFLDKQKLIMIGALIVILLTLLFGFLIAKNIVDSIDTVQQGLKKFFDLLSRKIDKNEQIRIDIPNKDEFGEMTKEINQNVEILRDKLKNDIKFIESATNVLSDLREGNIETRLKAEVSSNELNELKTVINDMLDNLEDRIIFEIKERTKQEQLLIQQSKLAAMGNMIGNIAHQWRQPLAEIGSILINIQVKKEHNDLSDAVFEKSIEECEVILSHMSNTISDFQNFFKPSKEKTLFSLEDACRSASNIIESSLKYNNIAFTLDIKEDSTILGYPREFAQAILNILSNAKDVLIERKTINPYIELYVTKGKKYSLIKIKDNGGGIQENLLERIFEPYFTTKHAKQGTGIGLYMSKIIIEENMHGYIHVQNSSEGAIFTIKLLS